MLVIAAQAAVFRYRDPEVSSSGASRGAPIRAKIRRRHRLAPTIVRQRWHARSHRASRPYYKPGSRFEALACDRLKPMRITKRITTRSPAKALGRLGKPEAVAAHNMGASVGRPPRPAPPRLDHQFGDCLGVPPLFRLVHCITNLTTFTKERRGVSPPVCSSLLKLTSECRSY